MRHFLLFAGYNYYPDGGIDDLVTQCWASDIDLDNSLQMLRDEAAKYEWWQICVIDTFGIRLFEDSWNTHNLESE